jgi:hypothetical protein
MKTTHQQRPQNYQSKYHQYQPQKTVKSRGFESSSESYLIKHYKYIF